MANEPRTGEIILRDMRGNDLFRITRAVDGVLTIRERPQVNTGEYSTREDKIAALYDAAHSIETAIRELQGERNV